MNRRVQVRAAVFARGVPGRRVPITARGPTPGFLLPLKRFRRRPVDSVLVECVGEVDDLRFIANTAQLIDHPAEGFIHAFFRSVRSAVEGEERDSADEQDRYTRQYQFVHGFLLGPRLVQCRARKQAVACEVNRLLTRAVLYRRPDRLLTRAVLYRRPDRLLTRAVLYRRPDRLLTRAVLYRRPDRLLT